MSLQWGHVLSDVEILDRGARLQIHLRLQWGHVLSDVEIAWTAPISPGRLIASMGPRPFRRGNKRRAAMLGYDMPVLQWGHVLSDVEMETQAEPKPTPSRLQWGHVLSDVEMTFLEGPL